MTTTATTKPASRRLRSSPHLSAFPLFVLAVTLGLCGGYLDVILIVAKKLFWNEEGYYRNAADFPWTVPLGHAVLTSLLAVAVAGVSRLRPRPISLRTASWLFATFALWSALLRLPLYGACSLVLAMGVARPISNVICQQITLHGFYSRRVWRGLRAGLVPICILAGLSLGSQTFREWRAVASLPETSPTARNAILIVWDTVRAFNVSVNGYPRRTTPNLARWAAKGVTYKRAVAAAPWTYPSHSCFFTGQWPNRLNTQWKLTLDTADPTLAEYLTSRGYQTAGFAANTNCCSYESGLARGFSRYEDYALTPRSILTRTVPGHWLATHAMLFADDPAKKWLGLQSRGAGEINDAFLSWLGQRRTDRPFFAFLNYFDAHEPYIPPRNFAGRFGIAPVTPLDYQFLYDFVGLPKSMLKRRYIEMAVDCYDDCIAYLDEELGRLLDRLEAQGLLNNTDVIITSDHGESFGDHNVIGHGYSVDLDEVGVPLVILSPTAPAGKEVRGAVSLRDIPATLVDLLGLAADSPFPGHSLQVYWKLKPDESFAERTSPAFSERVDARTFKGISQGEKPESASITLSLIATGHHYIRDLTGAEQLYDLLRDPYEQSGLMESSEAKPGVARYRGMLLEVLTASPGSAEVEQAYLEHYRTHLKEEVPEHSPPQIVKVP